MARRDRGVRRLAYFSNGKVWGPEGPSSGETPSEARWRLFACLARRADLAKICAAKFLPEVETIELDDAAHFVEAGTHALSNAVAESLFPHSGASCGQRTSTCRGGLVVEVRSNDGRAVVVVARVEDEAYRVPDPLGRFDRSQFVEKKYLHVKNGAQHVEFGGLYRGVVGVLNLFQQF